MIGESGESDDVAGRTDVSQSRLQLIWEVLVFQLKLTVDGLRDFILVPISLIAAILGLLFGGKNPAQYFHRVINFGRRTEYWINLFGQRKVEGTADEIISPLQEKVLRQARTQPWLVRVGRKMNAAIDELDSDDPDDNISRKTGKRTVDSSQAKNS